MTITKTGAYQLSMPEYRGQAADLLSMSSSDATILVGDKTPAHVKAAWEEEEGFERKSALGTVIHCLILEPHRRTSAISIIDAKNFQTKDAKTARDAALADNRTPILAEDYARACRVADATRSHPDAAPYLDGGDAELSLFAKDSELGIYVKARPDLISPRRAIVEVKSVASCSTEFLERRVYAGCWFIQSFWHCDVFARVFGDMPDEYVWICVEQEPPHCVRVFNPTDYALAKGMEKSIAARKVFAEAARANSWPGYPLGKGQLGLPSFAHFKLEEESLETGSRGMEAVRLGEELNASPFG